MKVPFSQIIQDEFAHVPTSDQNDLIDRLDRFAANNGPDNILLIKGFAGTGKTALMGAMVRSLSKINRNAVLLAPTGRAAKVLSAFAKRPAFTIHKMIYQLKTGSGYVRFALRNNSMKHTFFIVDESSMIGSGGGLQSGWAGADGSLLSDLVEFVFSGHGNKLMLIGDPAQLPPVGLSISQALEPKHMAGYGQEVVQCMLKQVVRQQLLSGILHNATSLREHMAARNTEFHFDILDFQDVVRVDGYGLEEELNAAYNQYGDEGCLIVCRSNKRAYQFNMQVRHRIKWMEEEISAGDMMMCVRNNYYWLESNSKAAFIANGDTLEILRFTSEESMYGFRFANATVRLTDYPEEKDLDVKILLDTLSTEHPALAPEDQQLLYERVLEDYEDEPSPAKKREKMKKNPYFNALQIKYAYAVTCHKAQGGQWPAVFVDQGYLTKEMIDMGYLRWLYTAITRATQKVYLVNFSDDFF